MFNSIISFSGCLKFHDSNSCWPYLAESWDVESSSSIVPIILGLGITAEYVYTSVPLNVQTNCNFIVNTENLKSMEDIRCNDCGSWINNGTRKLYLEIRNETDPKKIKVKVLQRGGKAPRGRCWCLTRSYFVLKQSKDFKKVITSLQGNTCIHAGHFIK